MTPEKIIVPEELLSKLFAVMQGFTGVGKTNPRPIKELIEVLKKHSELLSTLIDSKLIIDSSLKCLE
jgi:hypothetical protein